MEFFTDLLAEGNTFLLFPFIAGVLGSVAFGVVGSYVVVRRISYIASAIAHSVLGGMGAAIYLKHSYGWDWLTPEVGGLLTAILATGLITLIRRFGSLREDSLIVAMSAVGMASGILLIHSTPGYNDLSAYLFGDILFVSESDLWLIVSLNVLIVAVCWIFYHKLLAVCFDEDFARLRGINSSFYNFLLLLVTAITVVMMVNIVGIILIIALLTIPASTASMFSRHLWQMMVLSSVLCLISVVSGFSISHSLDKPTGPVIVLVCVGIFLVLVGGKALFNKFRKVQKA